MRKVVFSTKLGTNKVYVHVTLFSVTPDLFLGFLRNPRNLNIYSLTKSISLESPGGEVLNEVTFTFFFEQYQK